MRLVNDEIDRIERTLAPSRDGTRVVLCECGRPACNEQLLVPVEDVRRVRSDQWAFLVAPGHAQPELERAERCEPGYDVVRLLPAARALAAEIDV